VHVPALLRPGPPADGIHDADPAAVGLSVRLTSRLRWHGTCGGGEWASSPGGARPETSVSRGYRAPGSQPAKIGRRGLAGRVHGGGPGPFAVPGPPLSPRSDLSVTVTAAHAHRAGNVR